MLLYNSANQSMRTADNIYEDFIFIIFFLIGIHPCKAEQPLWGMELQETEAQKN